MLSMSGRDCCDMEPRVNVNGTSDGQGFASSRSEVSTRMAGGRDSKVSGSRGRVGAAAPPRMQYLWTIPPRLVPCPAENEEPDLLGLGSDDDDDSWPSADSSGDLLLGQDCQPAPFALLEENSTYPPEAEQRRPLHHSGGHVQRADTSVSRKHTQTCYPQIEIDLPSAPSAGRGDACNTAKIRLEISGACSSNVTVSVSTSFRPPAAREVHRAQSQLPEPERPEEPEEIWTEEEEQQQLARVCGHLQASGWYYGRMSWQQAQQCLQNTAEGTYLARDSNDPRFLFSLTVQTCQGPTSVRVHFSRGQFSLDAADQLAKNMPHFRHLNSLVEYYSKHAHFLYDQRGKLMLRLRLVQPLLKEVPTLQHICRLAIHRREREAGRSVVPRGLLPKTLEQYLRNYPFTR